MIGNIPLDTKTHDFQHHLQRETWDEGRGPTTQFESKLERAQEPFAPPQSPDAAQGTPDIDWRPSLVQTRWKTLRWHKKSRHSYPWFQRFPCPITSLNVRVGRCPHVSLLQAPAQKVLGGGKIHRVPCGGEIVPWNFAMLTATRSTGDWEGGPGRARVHATHQCTFSVAQWTAGVAGGSDKPQATGAPQAPSQRQPRLLCPVLAVPCQPKSRVYTQ